MWEGDSPASAPSLCSHQPLPQDRVTVGQEGTSGSHLRNSCPGVTWLMPQLETLINQAQSKEEFRTAEDVDFEESRERAKLC